MRTIRLQKFMIGRQAGNNIGEYVFSVRKYFAGIKMTNNNLRLFERDSQEVASKSSTNV